MAGVKKAFKILVLIALGLAVGVGYMQVRLNGVRDGLNADLDRARTVEDGLRKKYSSQKALAQGLLHAKAQLEGQVRMAQVKAAEAEEKIALCETRASEELAAVQARVAEKEHRLTLAAKEIDLLKTQNQEFRDALEKLKAECEVLVADLTSANHDLDIDLHQTQSELKKTAFDLARTREKNAELCGIAQELLERYQNKGVMGALLQKEPITQIKKVELEQMAQEYGDLIEKNTATENPEASN